MRSALLILVAAAALVAGGCEKTNACKQGTLFLTISFDGVARDADSVEVIVNGTAAQSQTFSRVAGAAPGTVEIDFPNGYVEGRSVQLTAVARQKGMKIGEGSGTVSLPAGCGTLKIAVGPSSDAGMMEAGTDAGGEAGVDATARVSGAIATTTAPAGTSTIRLVNPGLEYVAPKCAAVNGQTVCIKGGIGP